MNTYPIGHDFGNSLTKTIVYVNGKERQPTPMASAIKRGSLDDIVKGRKGVGQDVDVRKDALKPGDHVIEYNGQEYFIGQLALTQTKNSVLSTGVSSRYWELPSLLSLLTTSGNIITDTEYDLLVVTGLPVLSFDDKNIKRVKELLNGTHQFKLDTRSRIAHVKVGKVLSEAAGSIIVGGLDESSSTYGVIDIGSYTTDIYTMHGLTPMIDGCFGMEIGVSIVTDRVARNFEDKYDYPLDQSLQDIILPCYLVGDYGKMKLARREMVSDIMQWTTSELDGIASQIKDHVSRLWRTGSRGLVAANFSRVDIVGGGAYYLTEFIQKFVPRARMIKPPEFTNVRGYAWFANVMYSQRKIA